MKKKYYKDRICVDCGEIRKVLTCNRGIRCKSCSNTITSKGRYLLDISGLRFGKLIAIERSHIKNSRAFWKCKCDCGNEKILALSHLRSGNTKNCGCAYRTQKGKSKTITYKSYSNMMRRCYNEKLPHYARYGALGIKVCDRWKDGYLNFLEDMGERPIGTTLDRINPRGNYYKENCRWATPTEQGRNKRDNRIITHNGITALLIEWAEKTGIGVSTISWRINRGWPISEALSFEVSPLERSKKKLFDKV